MSREHSPTFCRICEPVCGMVATVEDGRLVALGPLMHVKDAQPLGINDGDAVRVSSPHGRIELAVTLTTDIVDGVIAIPHGWGHRGTGGWRVGNHARGANVNQLMSSAPEDLEALAGMARLTGVPVRVEAVESRTAKSLKIRNEGIKQRVNP